jgi:hypothetical protein
MTLSETASTPSAITMPLEVKKLKDERNDQRKDHSKKNRRPIL